MLVKIDVIFYFELNWLNIYICIHDGLLQTDDTFCGCVDSHVYLYVWLDIFEPLILSTES